MFLALGSKNKQGFVDGSITRPAANSPKLPQWTRCDVMVWCWIVNTIVPGIKEAYMTAKSAASLWTEIRERYGQSNGPLLFQLKKELKDISQGNDSIVEYFTKLKRRWDDIDELEVFSECSCGAMDKCTCNILKQVLESASREKLITFLMGLNGSYEHLRTNILSMDPIPNINRAYSILQQVESQENISLILQTGQDSSALAAMKAQASKSGKVKVLGMSGRKITVKTAIRDQSTMKGGVVLVTKGVTLWTPALSYILR
ncbi:uncharacterized protein LOC141595005 [Silene latifolia]|uniref:uncharacterized protein LOC141595005 n=1 Tax=Silene latifolia TaxID=37657 RepID=UPI003D7700C8